VRTPWLRRFLAYSIVRIVIATFATALAGGLTMAFVSELDNKRFHEGWPELCGVLAILFSYAIYVRLIEKRPVSELTFAGAPRELISGLLAGGALVSTAIGCLALLGAYTFTGLNAVGLGLIVGLAKMAFVGVFEEVLSRAIVFRLIERSLGSLAALAISSLLFALAHLPGDSSGALSVLIAVVAGALFGAGYLVTRRLWLCMGLHIGWNFTLGHLFSITVSGHPSEGLLAGSLNGPSWLTGGAYGLEGSVFALLVLSLAAALLLRRARSIGHWIAWRPRVNDLFQQSKALS
jgi:hypothetical protein